MAQLPALTERILRRTLDAYCARICPPSARYAVRLGWRLDDTRVTLHELRSFCGVPGAPHPVAIAQFRFSGSTGRWTLHVADPRGWRRYRPHASDSSFIALLREVDADPKGLFWCRVNGKSLRWCSSRGRCDDCDRRYCQVLGLGSLANAS
ncbi:MAG: DUF3024 domain-containing protein [Steroidobacteraceae bacterium]